MQWKALIAACARSSRPAAASRPTRRRSNCSSWQSGTPAFTGTSRLNGRLQSGSLPFCSAIVLSPQRAEGSKRWSAARLTQRSGHSPKPWQEARPGVQVKLLPQEGELYVFAQSVDRVAKERAIRRRQLKRLWTRFEELSTMELSREELLMKLGAARGQSRKAWRLVVVEVATDSPTFSYRLDRKKLRQARRREGRYLLRTNLVEEDPAKLWSHYLLLVTVEEAFKNLKGDLAIRPIFHQLEARIEAHVFIAFLAYCLHVTLARRLRALAPGLTPRSVLEKFAAMQMIDVHLPTTDGRELLLTRYTQPEPELNLLLKKLKLDLPLQPPPKITA